jgi:septal ring factor EnvC (AmiA/AmiB activator)
MMSRRDRVNEHNALYHQEDAGSVEEMLDDLFRLIGGGGVDLRGIRDQADVALRIARVEHDVKTILRVLEKLMINTDALVTAAKRAQKDNADLLAVLKNTRDNGKELAAKLQAAIDQLAALPADTSAQEAAIASVVADLNKMADDTEAAVQDNPAVPDLPPAPPAGAVQQ